jgi:outer membrane protein TolC
MRILLGGLLVLHTSLALGQTKPTPTTGWQTVFFESPTTALPLLMTAAIKHSAQQKSLEIGKAISSNDIKLVKRSILGGVGVAGSYTYGNQGSVGAIDPANPNQFNTYSSTRYSAGISVGVPLLQIITRGSLIKKEELNYQRAELARQDQENQLRQQIIQLYQSVLLAKKLLTLQQEAYVTVQTNYRLADKAFRQGQLSLPDFSSTSSQLTQAAMSQESALNQYNTAFMLLEETVGTKISTLMTNP